jgi:hypothetical protein
MHRPTSRTRATVQKSTDTGYCACMGMVVAAWPAQCCSLASRCWPTVAHHPRQLPAAGFEDKVNMYLPPLLMPQSAPLAVPVTSTTQPVPASSGLERQPNTPLCTHWTKTRTASVATLSSNAGESDNDMAGATLSPLSWHVPVPLPAATTSPVIMASALCKGHKAV